MNFSTTGSQNVKSVGSCVLFDPKTGAIHHVHHVVTMEGAAETSEAELEKETVGAARRLGLGTARLRVLHVAQDAFAERAHYSVDLRNRTLHKEPLPPRSGERTLIS